MGSIISFAFFNFIHRDKRAAFQEYLNNDIDAQADFAASITAQLISKHTNDEIIKKGLFCCRAILHSKGYKEAILSELHNSVNTCESINPVVLVFGCQTDEILESRVDAAIYLISNLCTNVELAFIGCAPEREKVKIPDESARMRAIYEHRIKNGHLSQQNPNRTKSVCVFSEDASQNTKQNIHRFFNGGYLSSDKKYDLYFVSSTFHLLRLATDCEKYLNANPVHMKNIKRIVLCGADDVNQPSITAKSGNYIKYMFFDIYSHLMKDSNFFE